MFFQLLSWVIMGKNGVLSIISILTKGIKQKKSNNHGIPHFFFCCFDDEQIINYEWPYVRPSAILGSFLTFESNVTNWASVCPWNLLAFSMGIFDFLRQCLCESNFPWCSIETGLQHIIQRKLLLMFFGWLFLNIHWTSGSKKPFSEYFEHFPLF